MHQQLLFIGEPQKFVEKSSEILLNLTCPTLQDFRWYKDIFLSKVFVRPDYQQTCWKERFLEGLTKLFAAKVRERLVRENNTNERDFQRLTYGDLITTINREGISISTDLRLKEKLKNKNKLLEKSSEIFVIKS